MKQPGDAHNLTFLGALREIASGNPDCVTAEVYEERIDTCLQCSACTPVRVCAVCKCIIPLKAKFTNASCPEGRWRQ